MTDFPKTKGATMYAQVTSVTVFPQDGSEPLQTVVSQLDFETKEQFMAWNSDPDEASDIRQLIEKK